MVRNRIYFFIMKNKLLSKTFRLIEILVENGKPMSISELGACAGLQASTARRIVSDLCELGYIRKADYHHVEPDLGMAYVSQAIFNDRFFPSKALNLLKTEVGELGISCALAGLHNLHVVYFFRLVDRHESAPWRWPIHASNLAVCLLLEQYGIEEARRILFQDAEAWFGSQKKAEDSCAEIERRLLFSLKRGYSLEDNSNFYNISFPLKYGKTLYGVSFFNLKDSRHRKDVSMLVMQCSKVRNRLQELLESIDKT